jgi:hypothetical protein
VPPALTAAATTSRVRREVRAFVELFALSGFAIAQPLLDLFGRAPHQLAFRGAEGVDVVLFAAGVVLLAPLVLWLVAVPSNLAGARVRRVVHVVLLSVLVWAFAVQVLRPLGDGLPLMAAAVACAGAGAFLYLRFAATRLWLAFAALAPIVFAALFLLTSPASRLITGDRVAALAQDIETPVPIVLVVFDEFPLASLLDGAGDVDAELYPNFADLAADAHWFRNTTGVSTFTWQALPSILTGQLPGEETAPFAADHPDNLFTLLGSSYDLNVTESMTRLCPTNLCEGSGQRIGSRRDIARDAWDVMRDRLSWSGPQGDLAAGFVEPAVDIPEQDDLPDRQLPNTARFQALLDGITDDEVALHFLHVLLPHQPLRFLPSGRTYAHPDPDIGHDGDNWGPEEWPARLGRHRHLLQVRYVDGLIGQLLAKLREVDVYDEALIIVTADHGIAFRPGGPIRLVEEQELDAQTAPELLWVPLFVKLPGQQDGEVSDANVLTIDILPTIADVLGTELPGAVDGRSTLGPPRSGTAKPFRYGYVYEFGIGVGDEIEVDGAAGLEGVLDLSVDELLPPAGSADRIWRIGPSSRLVGTPAADLPRVDARVLDPAPVFDPGDGTAPALVRAEVPDDPGEAYAVAVNGTVGATATSFPDGGRSVVAVMVSDERFRPGPNEITLHRIEPGPADGGGAG